MCTECCTAPIKAASSVDSTTLTLEQHIIWKCLLLPHLRHVPTLCCLSLASPWDNFGLLWLLHQNVNSSLISEISSQEGLLPFDWLRPLAVLVASSKFKSGSICSFSNRAVLCNPMIQLCIVSFCSAPKLQCSDRQYRSVMKSSTSLPSSCFLLSRALCGPDCPRLSSSGLRQKCSNLLSHLSHSSGCVKLKCSGGETWKMAIFVSCGTLTSLSGTRRVVRNGTCSSLSDRLGHRYHHVLWVC